MILAKNIKYWREYSQLSLAEQREIEKYLEEYKQAYIEKNAFKFKKGKYITKRVK